MNKNRFTDKQLGVIHGTFYQLCTKSIEEGDLLKAQEYLEILNAASGEGCAQYNTIEDLWISARNSWDDLLEKAAQTTEEKAMLAFYKWSKSNEKELTDELYRAVDAYVDERMALKECPIDDEIEYVWKLDVMKITIQLGPCVTQEEALKMNSIVDEIIKRRKGNKQL